MVLDHIVVVFQFFFFVFFKAEPWVWRTSDDFLGFSKVNLWVSSVFF